MARKRRRVSSDEALFELPQTGNLLRINNHDSSVFEQVELRDVSLEYGSAFAFYIPAIFGDGDCPKATLPEITYLPIEFVVEEPTSLPLPRLPHYDTSTSFMDSLAYRPLCIVPPTYTDHLSPPIRFDILTKFELPRLPRLPIPAFHFEPDFREINVTLATFSFLPDFPEDHTETQISIETEMILSPNPQCDFLDDFLKARGQLKLRKIPEEISIKFDSSSKKFLVTAESLLSQASEEEWVLIAEIIRTWLTAGLIEAKAAAEKIASQGPLWDDFRRLQLCMHALSSLESCPRCEALDFLGERNILISARGNLETLAAKLSVKLVDDSTDSIFREIEKTKTALISEAALLGDPLEDKKLDFDAACATVVFMYIPLFPQIPVRHRIAVKLEDLTPAIREIFDFEKSSKADLEICLVASSDILLFYPNLVSCLKCKIVERDFLGPANPHFLLNANTAVFIISEKTRVTSEVLTKAAVHYSVVIAVCLTRILPSPRPGLLVKFCDDLEDAAGVIFRELSRHGNFLHIGDEKFPDFFLSNFMKLNVHEISAISHAFSLTEFFSLKKPRMQTDLPFLNKSIIDFFAAPESVENPLLLSSLIFTDSPSLDLSDAWQRSPSE